jgi:hypothetical protein
VSSGVPPSLIEEKDAARIEDRAASLDEGDELKRRGIEDRVASLRVGRMKMKAREIKDQRSRKLNEG